MRRFQGMTVALLAVAATVVMPVACAAAPHVDAELLARRELRALDGSRLRLAQYQGEVVVVNFWASWCTPCRRELPSLNVLHGELSNRGGRVIAVSIDERRANAERFVRRHKLSLPIVHDGPNGLARALDLEHVPYTVVLDREGNVAFTTAASGDAAVVAIRAAAMKLLASPLPETRAGGEETR